jgi:hypothetical protein
MWKRIKDNFDSGIEKIKWFSTLISDRLKIEFSIIKLLHDRDKKEKDRAEKMRVIGERIFELREHLDRGLLKDKAIMESMSEIEKIDSEIEDMKKKVSEMSKVED